MNLIKLAIALLLTVMPTLTASADSERFHGAFTLDLTVGDPVCRQSTGSIEIGSTYSNRANPYYIYIPSEDKQASYTFTKANGDVYTRTIALLDESRFRFFQKHATSSYSTTIDLAFVYSDDYRSFTATGSETGGAACEGPVIYIGSKLGNRKNGSDHP